MRRPSMAKVQRVFTEILIREVKRSRKVGFKGKIVLPDFGWLTWRPGKVINEKTGERCVLFHFFIHPAFRNDLSYGDFNYYRDQYDRPEWARLDNLRKEYYRRYKNGGPIDDILGVNRDGSIKKNKNIY